MSVDDRPEAPLVDLARLQAEINEEVRRRRAAGDFPPGLERELDAAFARYAPAGAGDDFDEVMVQAETQSFIHVDVVTASNTPGVAYVKRALRKVMAWYLRFLAQQVTAFAGAITRAVKLLGERVSTLETATIVAGERTLAEIRDRRSGPDLAPWVPAVVGQLGTVRGRVLHTECGTGALLAALDQAGADAYGVEPVESQAMEASRAGLDVRADDALAHLRALPDGALAGLILSGCVDALALGEVLELADRAARVLGPGGTVVVISSDPEAWARAADPVVADLAPGRPLHAATWEHLLRSRGFDTVTALDGAHLQGAAPAALAPVPADTPNAAVINANTERLNRLLFSPPSYGLVARRNS